MNLRLHYFRAARVVSGRRAAPLAWALAGAVALVGSVHARAQYVGMVSKDPSTPTLRAVGVLEWTGPAGKPKFSRLVPISIYDGTQLQDAGIYLARPQPLAVSGSVEYQLKQDGRTVGLFDISRAGRQLGSWVGFGDWKPVPHPQLAFAMTASDDDSEDDDKPVLHRKQHPDDAAAPQTAKAGPGASPAPDPAPDSDRPKLHRQDSAATSAPAAGDDDDRPILHEPKPEKPAQPVSAGGTVSGLPSISDPDRPRLIPGQVNGTSITVTPDLMGLPPDMKQMVAVSDAVNRPDHPWNYTWANPEDQAKMKSMLEDAARAALAGSQKPAVQAAAQPKSRKTARHKKAMAEPQPEPLELQDEQFRVLELSYGAGATLVLSADTGGPLAQEKFVTLIAQPDLYGNLNVLMKSVTDGGHLDLTPRMKLIDAVDALADNRGDLLFELRGPGSRQFALYRVLRGQADRIFVTSGGDFGAAE